MEDIIKRIQDGDKNAYTELYEKTKRMVMYNIRLKGVSPDDEEDVAQETYKKVFEKIGTLEKQEDVCLWIRSIAANTAVDHMRRSGKIQTVSMDEITGPEEAEISEEILLPEDAVEREMALKELGDIMRALPADSYKLLAARYYNKEDYKTIEAELGISAATARKRVQRILGDMRETICAKRKKGTTVLAATAAAPVLSMFFAEDAEAAVVPAGLSAKVAAVEACSAAAAGTGKTAISMLTGLITKKAAVIALIGALALSGGIASVPGCGETAETESTAVVTETPKPTQKATPIPTKKATATPTPTKKPAATPTPTKKETPKPTSTPKATTTPKQETPKQETPVPTKTPTTAPAAHTHTWVVSTKTVTDKAAWDEQVMTKEAWDEQIVVKEAWDEQVVVKEAWDEQVEVSAAYDEPVYEYYYTCNICGYQTQDGWDIAFHTLDVCGGGYHTERTQVDTIHHDAGYETVHHDAEYTTVHHDAEYTTVHHDAEYTTVHHDAVTHTETTYTCSGCGATK